MIAPLHLRRQSTRLLATSLIAASLCLGAALPALAEHHQPVSLTSLSAADLVDEQYVANGHPDELWRIRGLYSHRIGRDSEAVSSFMRSALYADKFSQFYLSQLYWHGQGVPQDRVLAYVWSDLAAERGGIRLLAYRERLWEALTEEERAQVAERGPALYAEYGDPTAMPRMEQELIRFRRQSTGSRLGYSSQDMDIGFGPPTGGSFRYQVGRYVGGASTGDRFYADARTQSAAYWEAKQAEIERKAGRVDVGEIEQARKPIRNPAPATLPNREN